MVRKEGRSEKWQRTGPAPATSRSLADPLAARLLAVTSDSAAKGSAKSLEVASAAPVHCHFSLTPSFLTMCSSEHCLLYSNPIVQADIRRTTLSYTSLAYAVV